jgi:hypothetical protein
VSPPVDEFRVRGEVEVPFGRVGDAGGLGMWRAGMRRGYDGGWEGERRVWLSEREMR